MDKRKTPLLIVIATVLIICANILLGVILADHSKTALKKLIANRMLDITNTAALLIDGNALRDLTADDQGTAAYKKINDTLAAFHHDADLKYIYCIRDMGGKRFVFTVDPTVKDPGKFGDPIAYTDALYIASTGTAATDDEPYSDGWGRFYSAYSPVFDSHGRVAGIVAADFSADWYEEQISHQRTLIEVFIVFSTLVCLFLMGIVIKRTHALGQTLGTAYALNKQLSSISNIYVSMYDVDINHNTFTEIKSTRVFRANIGKLTEKGADAMMKELAQKASTTVSRNEMQQFVDIHTLKDRLENSETISKEFIDNTIDRWVRLRFIVSQRDKSGSPTNVLLMEEDIDKEKKAREELVDMSERAIAANEAKSSFISVLSHDIRTPVSVVLGMNEMILRECGEQNVIGYAKSIKTAGSMLLGLINNILDFSKIEAGKLELIPVEYDLSVMINDLVDMTQAQADSKGLSLSLDFDRDTPKWLFGDELRIRQIITNILTNAVKYTINGGITFTVGYEPADNDKNSIILYIAVKDTGIGIKPEDMSKLFKEFVRIDERRNRTVEGTGLGMTITQSLLGMMGSALQVNSGYGLGSKFYFHLKQRVVRWEPLGDYEASYSANKNDRHAYHEKFTAPNALILVVDDNPMNLMVFKNLLKSTLIRIDTANNADAGLKLASEKKYDVLFLDHMMPNKDGIEMLHELREQHDRPNFETPAICLTANAVSGARNKYISEGFDDYITKPIDSEKLEDLLLTYLPSERLEAPVSKVNIVEEAHGIPDILAPLEGEAWIDIPLGIKNSGSVDSYLSLLRIFYESLDKRVEEIEDFYKSGNLKDYTIKVHALKSSAKIIGAREFGAEAQQLENAGSSGNMDYIREHEDDFIAKCRSFKAPLSKVFSDAKEEAALEDKPEADPQMMEDIFVQIRIAADDMDSDRLEDIFTDAEQYRIPARYEIIWTQLKKALEQYDFDKMLSLLPKKDENK